MGFDPLDPHTNTKPRAGRKKKAFWSQEDLLSKALCDLLRLKGKRDWIWMHIPNEGKRSPAYGAKMKAMGLLAGAPDYVFISPMGKVHFIELKTGKNSLGKSQREFRDKCAVYGHPFEVVRDMDRAYKILRKWGVM